MNTEQLRTQLIELGVNKCNALMLHASLRKMGPIQGGAEALFDLLEDLMPKESAIVMPLGAEPGAPFDANTTPAEKEIGALAEIFRCRTGTQVNDHVAGRFAASGKLASMLLNPTPLNDYLGPGSLLDRFTQINGSVLRIGVDLDTVTLTHYAEYLANIPNKKRVTRIYRHARLGTQFIESLDDSEGIVVWDKGDYFSQILVDYLGAGRAKLGVVGNAVAERLNAGDFVSYAVDWLESQFS